MVPNHEALGLMSRGDASRTYARYGVCVADLSRRGPGGVKLGVIAERHQQRGDQQKPSDRVARLAKSHEETHGANPKARNAFAP